MHPDTVPPQAPAAAASSALSVVHPAVISPTAVSALCAPSAALAMLSSPPVPTVIAEVPAEAEVDASLGLTKSEEAPALDRPALLRIFRDATARGMASGEPVELVGSSTNESGFKGVHKQNAKWLCQVSYNNMNFKVGKYSTKEQAAMAYALCAREIESLKPSVAPPPKFSKGVAGAKMGPTAAAAAAAYAVAMGGASSAQEQGAAAVTVDYTPGPEKLALVVTPTGTNSSRGGDECRVDGELFLQSRSQLVVTLVPTEPNPLPPPLALASADAATATAAAAAAAADAATAAAAAADAAGAAVAAAQAQAAAAQAAQAASDATAAAQAAQAAPPPARCRLRLVLVDDQDPPNVLQPLWRVLEPSDVQAMPGADGTTRFPPIRIITTPYSESVKFLRLAAVPAADATSSGSLACVALSEKLRVVGKLSRSLTKAKFSDEHKVSASEDAHAAAAHAASRAAAAAAAAAQRGPPPAYTQAGSVRQHYEVQPGGPMHQRPVIGGGLPYYASVALEVEQRAANGGAAAAPATPSAGAAVPLGANTIGISLGGGWATACADDATTAHALVHAPPGALLGAAAQRQAPAALLGAATTDGAPKPGVAAAANALSWSADGTGSPHAYAVATSAGAAATTELTASDAAAVARSDAAVAAAALAAQRHQVDAAAVARSDTAVAAAAAAPPAPERRASDLGAETVQGQYYAGSMMGAPASAAGAPPTGAPAATAAGLAAMFSARPMTGAGLAAALSAAPPPDGGSPRPDAAGTPDAKRQRQMDTSEVTI